MSLFARNASRALWSATRITYGHVQLPAIRNTFASIVSYINHTPPYRTHLTPPHCTTLSLIECPALRVTSAQPTAASFKGRYKEDISKSLDPTGLDVVELIKAEHKLVDTLFEAYQAENNPQQKRGIANNIIKLLSIHGPTHSHHTRTHTALPSPSQCHSHHCPFVVLFQVMPRRCPSIPSWPRTCPTATRW